MMQREPFNDYEKVYIDDYKDILSIINDENNKYDGTDGTFKFFLDEKQSNKLLQFIKDTGSIIESYEYFYNKVKSVESNFL